MTLEKRESGKRRRRGKVKGGKGITGRRTIYHQVCSVFLVVFQLGLCERDLNNVLYENRKIPNNDESLPSNTASAGCKKQGLKQKQIEKDDVCPICQDDIYKTKKSLSFCKYVYF